MRLKDIGEFGFIDRIRSGCLIRSQGVLQGIGDDCCVFRISPGLVSLLTTDMLVEDIHFLRRGISPFQLGRKAVAVSISDIAAMGGIPREAVISIAIPEKMEVEYLDTLYEGMRDCAGEFDVNLLGGDTTAAPAHLVINIALVGEAAADEVLYRWGAQAEDVIFLTGSVGESAAGLDLLLSGRTFDGKEILLDAHHDPRPHVKEGRIIAGLKIAHALIDVSDGVASDLGHICTESKAGAVIEQKQLPITPLFRAYCRQFDLPYLHLALEVGEDYVLLGTVPKEKAEPLGEALRSEGCDFFPIGEITAEPGLRLKCTDGSLRDIQPGGWDHFR